MDFAMRTHPCRQPSYTKKRQVLAEEEEPSTLSRVPVNCGMRKVKCGMDGAEICCGMVCKVRNEEC